MAALLIKNLPDTLHKRLKELAQGHHRSMTGEAIVLLEDAVNRNLRLNGFGSALKGQFPLTQKFINTAKRKGRA